MTNFEGIIKFNTDRLLTTFDSDVEYTLLEEELQEFFWATENIDRVDALCDLIVVAVGGLYQLGYDPEKALAETVKEVLSRKGTTNQITGKWEKDPNQSPDTLYKADYTTAER